MSYSVKEIYLTLQGEGVQSGRPAVFLRFSGCNLWNGHEAGRALGVGQCSLWCDTNFVGTDGHLGGRFNSAADLAAAVRGEWPADTSEGALVVCTGGEPLLQLDDVLTEALRNQGFEIAVETNGTMMPPEGIDWLCVSPKAGSHLVIRSGDELKLVFPQAGAEPHQYEALDFRHFLLQPLDDEARIAHTRSALDYCRAHPRWRLSLQMHKYLGIP